MKKDEIAINWIRLILEANCNLVAKITEKNADAQSESTEGNLLR